MRSRENWDILFLFNGKINAILLSALIFLKYFTHTLMFILLNVNKRALYIICKVLLCDKNCYFIDHQQYSKVNDESKVYINLFECLKF